ncbi:MAG: hypothetical protein M3Y84_13610 [Acidobacteriota bacterium]|nr:hypothetical protein [Acidobacteriota bacterium]
MSKRISQFVALLSVVTLVFVVLSAKHSSEAAAPQRPGITARGATRNAAIIAATSAVLKETSEIRELPILRPVKSGAQSRVEIERMLVKNLDEQMTAAEMHATQLSLRKFGLVSSDFQYRPFVIKLLTEQVAGYYDPRAREFHLADWLDLEGQKPVMAHELTHALQDQHFNLRRFEKWPHGDSDAELAAHALIEGDATLAMTIYMAKNPLVALAFTRSLASSGTSSEQFNQAPRALRESLIFPYLQGLEWTSQLYKRGGWDMVSKAFTRLPQSSEQILHPEKYFNYEHPIKVVLPDFTNLLNANGSSAVSTHRSLPVAHRPLPTIAWHRVDSDVNGEWSYYLILDQFLNSPAESKRAAAGWAGDRFALYEGSKPGQVFIAQASVWDTANDAREFFDAYVKRTERRYADAKPVELPLADSDDLRAWQTSEGGVVIELRGLRVLIVEGVPEGVASKALIGALG